jgi:hypothetical protein
MVVTCWGIMSVARKRVKRMPFPLKRSFAKANAARDAESSVITTVEMVITALLMNDLPKGKTSKTFRNEARLGSAGIHCIGTARSAPLSLRDVEIIQRKGTATIKAMVPASR